MSYLTLAAAVRLEDVIKGSRFIAHARPVPDVTSAERVTEEISTTHADATHNCWAYRIGDVYRFSDDGEPGGTAGRPMLEVLTQRGLDRIVAVVTRYYGGTKLGAGGLVRAYGGTLAKALDTAIVREVKPRVALSVHVPFAHLDVVHRLVDSTPELHKGSSDFDAEGMTLTLTLPAAQQDLFADALRDATRDDAKVLSAEPLPF
ncbi:MAG: YigZ family protein [Trueperaceae bacterium]|nr:YigZ family protein [Trueperaceae bacterium]